MSRKPNLPPGHYELDANNPRDADEFGADRSLLTPFGDVMDPGTGGWGQTSPDHPALNDGGLISLTDPLADSAARARQERDAEFSSNWVDNDLAKGGPLHRHAKHGPAVVTEDDIDPEPEAGGVERTGPAAHRKHVRKPDRDHASTQANLRREAAPLKALLERPDGGGGKSGWNMGE